MISPESLSKANTEHAHQTALFCWASQNFTKYPELRCMYAIPNGGERNPIVAAHLKAEGVRSGVPDIFLSWPKANWHGLYIELKRPASKGQPEGRVSKDQEVWIARLKNAGYGVAVCIGWEQARDILVEYITFQGY